MVSTTTKLKYSTAKLGRAAGTILPIFKRETLADFTRGILREHEDIRQAVIRNPNYLPVLEKHVYDSFQKYKGVIRGGKLVDSWDRVAATAGLVGDALGPFTSGAGWLAGLGEQFVDLIPKGIYTAYYLTKTGDWKAIPYWGLVEAASFIPYVGKAIDMTNIYVNRARKMTMKKATDDFRRTIKMSDLEKRISGPN